MPHDSLVTRVFCCRKSRQNSNGVTPNGGAKCGWGRLSAGAVAENWRLSTRSVANLARTQVYHTCLQHVRRDAARRAGLPATASQLLVMTVTTDDCYFVKDVNRIGEKPSSLKSTTSSVAASIYSSRHYSNTSGPKFTVLWGHVEDIFLLNKFFSDCRYVP